jgi:hypothetical protein
MGLAGFSLPVQYFSVCGCVLAAIAILGLT